MTPILIADIEEGGRLKLNAMTKTGEMVRVAIGDQATNLSAAVWEAVAGYTTTYTLPSHHFSDTYLVATDNGVVKMVGNIVHYTPAVFGNGGFWVNGVFHNVLVRPAAPITPVITLPVTGALETAPTVACATAAYSANIAGSTHYSTRWQIATDANFVNIVSDVISTTDKITYTSPYLTGGVKHYLRAKHIGQV